MLIWLNEIVLKSAISRHGKVLVNSTLLIWHNEIVLKSAIPRHGKVLVISTLLIWLNEIVEFRVKKMMWWMQPKDYLCRRWC